MKVKIALIAVLFVGFLGSASAQKYKSDVELDGYHGKIMNVEQKLYEARVYGDQMERGELMEHLQGRIKRNGAERFINKLFVKIKFSDFQQTTVECVGYAPNLEIYARLLETGWLRASRPVRLLGVGVRLSDTEIVEQLKLFDERATH